MAEADRRKLAAIVVADVVNYSRMMSADEAGTLAMLRDHRTALIDPTVREYDGRIVKSMGDGLLLEFSSVVNATHCAIDIQRGLAERNGEIDEDRRMVLRVGINLGDVITEGDDILGEGVNIAARLEELCSPGCMLLSGAAYDQLDGRPEFPATFLGERNLKKHIPTNPALQHLSGTQ